MAKNKISDRVNNLIQIQQEYWSKRKEREFTAGEKEAYRTLIDIEKVYKRTILQIEREINMFYGKYAKKENITLEEARQQLNRHELKSFNEYIQELIELHSKEITEDELNKLKILRAKARISRLDELQASIEYELDKMTKLTGDEIEKYLSQTFEEGYYTAAYDMDQYVARSISFNRLAPNQVKAALNTKYLASNFSSSLWTNSKKLMIILNQEIPRGLALGYNPRKLANLVSKKIQSNYNSTVRLVRTEYNRILNEATSEGYKACGVSEYKILATLDNRTSEICQEMDGEIFNLNDREIGVNYPPFHPNCRTTTIPYFEPDEIDEEYGGVGTRLAKDDNGNYYEVPADVTYKEWKSHLKEDSKGRVRYIP